MHISPAKLYKAIRRTFWRDTFNRDILVLVVISICIGSLLANAVAFAAASYFKQTLSSMVGDYGEYDIVIQVREEMKADAIAQMQKIISTTLPGAKLKEGPTIAGKTNLFVALPDADKTKTVYENRDSIFGSIPGGAAVGVMTEPRITVQGVPEGARQMLIDSIEKMDGVRFAFHDGSAIGVVLTSPDKVSAVNSQIDRLLAQYQVMEISFPVGYEPANPIKLGDTIAQSLQDNLHASFAQNVSVDGKNDDMTYAVSTMMEMRRFLTAYATQVTITPAPGVQFIKGDVVAFQGRAAQPPVPGAAVDKDNVLVQVTGLDGSGAAVALITQGDASELTNIQGFKVNNGIIAGPAGTAAYKNPRQELSQGLSESGKIVAQIPALSQDAQRSSAIALQALDTYGAGLSRMQATLDAVQAAGATLERATRGLAGLNTNALQTQVAASSRALGGLLNTMSLVEKLGGQAGDANNIAAAKSNLDNFQAALSVMDEAASNARRAQDAMDQVVANGNSTLATLRQFDVNGARQNISDIQAHANALSQVNVPAVTAQLQYMAAAMPNLRDDDISHTLSVLDKFIAGQVVPAARIQIMTDKGLSIAAMTPLIYQAVGHNNVSLYTTGAGVIEPDPRMQLYQVVTDVQGILSGMTAIIATALFLVLDHTAIMAALKRRRLANKVHYRGWRGVWQRLALTFTAPERQYGMAIGAIMLTAIFLAGRGGIPYLPWLGVPVLGAALGLLVANYAEKISPVSTEEVVAGEALGLSFDQVMREIVVPNGRPGLLLRLNRRKMFFR